VQISQQRFL